MPVGSYTIAVQFLGYAEATQANVQVTAGCTTSVNVSMEQTVLSRQEMIVTGTSCRRRTSSSRTSRASG